MASTLFMEEHLEALTEGADEVIDTLESFKRAVARGDIRAARRLIEQARVQIESFDVMEEA